MVEREDPRDIMNIIWLAYNSGYFDEQYDHASQERRKEFNALMEERNKQLKRRSLTLARKERKQDYDRNQSKLQPGENHNLEQYIKRMFRGANGYLDFRDEIPVSRAKSVTALVNLYKPHIAVHGRNSVAHLCPPKLIFTILTSGIEIQFHGGNDREISVINTIDQLKKLKDQLDRDKTAKVFRHNPEAITRSKALNLNGLFEELGTREDMRSRQQH